MLALRSVCLAGAGLLLSGCEDLDFADFATGLANVADSMLLADGVSYEDEHYRQELNGPCPAVWEYGLVDNQIYSRISNRSSRSMTVTTRWNTGLETSQFLSPGETGAFEYQTSSVEPEGVDVACE